MTASGPLPDVTVPTNAASQYRIADILPAGGYTLTARDPETGFTTRAQIYLQPARPRPTTCASRGGGR